MAVASEFPASEAEHRRVLGGEGPRNGTDEEQRPVAKASEVVACTTLCLWEPDADLMIRRAMGQERARRSEYAAEARKDGFNERYEESGTSTEIRAFEEMFATELRAARDTMEQVMAQETANADTPTLVSWWLEQLRELHSLVSGADHFLPTQLRQKFMTRLTEHETKLREERERLTPKKKFGFKNRSKVGKSTAADTAPESPAPASAASAGLRSTALPTGGAAQLAKADTFQAPAGCQGFRDQAGVTLIRAAGESMASGFALEDLSGCEVRLLSASTALWVRGLKKCTVFATPVKGVIYVTNCEDCTLYLGSRQLRIHTSQRVDFYVHVSSNGGGSKSEYS